MNIKDSLLGITNYPIPSTVVDNAVEENGLVGSADATQEVRASKPYQLVLATIYDFLAVAPVVQQSGVIITITDTQHELYTEKANAIRSKFDVDDQDGQYGYIGENY